MNNITRQVSPRSWLYCWHLRTVRWMKKSPFPTMLSIPLIMEAAALPVTKMRSWQLKNVFMLSCLNPLTSVPMPLLSTSPVPPKHLQTLWTSVLLSLAAPTRILSIPVVCQMKNITHLPMIWHWSHGQLSVTKNFVRSAALPVMSYVPPTRSLKNCWWIIIIIWSPATKPPNIWMIRYLPVRLVTQRQRWTPLSPAPPETAWIWSWSLWRVREPAKKVFPFTPIRPIFWIMLRRIFRR